MTDVESINTILRAQLIAQSGISAELIRDATTEYGAFLDTNLSGSIFESLSAANPKTMGYSLMTLRGFVTTAERCWGS